jgi:hypothetical protein
LRIRHKASAELVVSVHNRGTRALEGLSIDIDEHYLSHFSRIEMLPAGSAVTPGRVHVDLPPLGANERARVRMRLEADDWGRQHGRIQLSQRRQDELAHLNFSTLVLP